MFARFVCALLSFCAREFPEKSEIREPGKIIVECNSYVYDGDKPLKITCQYCIVFVRRAGTVDNQFKSSFSVKELPLLELILKNFKNCFFHWPGRTKMHHIYQNILKEGNSGHKYLRCPYLWHINIEILLIAIAQYKIDIVCSDAVREKSTGNDVGFITYLNIIFGLFRVR